MTVVAGNEISYALNGKFITKGSGERVRNVTYELEGLPEGLSVNPLTGVLSGVIYDIGTYSGTLKVITNCGVASAPLSISVRSPAPESKEWMVCSSSFHDSLLVTYRFPDSGITGRWTVTPGGGIAHITSGSSGCIKYRKYRGSTEYQIASLGCGISSGSINEDGSSTFVLSGSCRISSALQQCCSSRVCNLSWYIRVAYEVGGYSRNFSLRFPICVWVDSYGYATLATY